MPWIEGELYEPNYTTTGWTETECQNALAFAKLVGEELCVVFCYPAGYDVEKAVLEWGHWGEWQIKKNFYKELVKNNIITNYKNKEEYDRIHLQQGNRK